MARAYIGAWGEWAVRIIGGLLLLSATNTAVNGLMSIIYVMSRDGELPAVLPEAQRLRRPVGRRDRRRRRARDRAAVLPRPGDARVALRDRRRRRGRARLHPRRAPPAPAQVVPQGRRSARSALFLVVVWVTLAFTKLHALIFVTIVMAVGLILRGADQAATPERRPKPSLLRQAIMEQLPADALSPPKILLATAGSDEMADDALKIAQGRERGAGRDVRPRGRAVATRSRPRTRFTLDTDPAAQSLFTDFLEHGHRYGVPVIPMYDTGTNAPELIAEFAAMNGVDKVLIGSSRRGALHHMHQGQLPATAGKPAAAGDPGAGADGQGGGRRPEHVRDNFGRGSTRMTW